MKDPQQTYRDPAGSPELLRCCQPARVDAARAAAAGQPLAGATVVQQRGVEAASAGRAR